MTQRIFTTEILNGVESLIEANLKTSLSLQGIYRGNMAWLPPSDITQLVNGIWIHPGGVTIEEVTLPKGLQAKYPLRLVFVRRMDISNNILDTKISDGTNIVEFIYDNFRPSITLSGGQILWWLPRVIEYEPAEDAFVSAIQADLSAISIETEMLVRSKIG